MISRALTVSFVSALLVGAYAGCSDGTDTGGGGGGTMGGGYYNGGGGVTNTGGGSGGNGATGGSGSSSGSSSGATASSSGGTSSGSSSGSSSSSSGSSSGGSEAGAPAPEAGAPPMTLQEAFTQFANCMSYTDFTSTSANGVAAADIAKSQTTNYGDCNACHNAGDGGFWASWGQVQGQDMKQVMFNMTQQFPYITKWVTGTVDANGNFKDLAPSNAIENQSILSQQCQQGTPCHPKFQLDPAVAQAITDFVNGTITKWHANACGTSGGASDAGLGGGG